MGKKSIVSIENSNEESSEFILKNSKTSYRKWSEEENQLYVDFIKRNLLDFDTPKGRMPNKLFKRMSVALKGERTNQQCRTHHQKMLLKFSTN